MFSRQQLLQRGTARQDHIPSTAAKISGHGTEAETRSAQR
jgi:hypothetical protein